MSKATKDSLWLTSLPHYQLMNENKSDDTTVPQNFVLSDKTGKKGCMV
jgi:hypothetical protein